MIIPHEGLKRVQAELLITMAIVIIPIKLEPCKHTNDLIVSGDRENSDSG
jgi:hypothetical protein